MTSFCHDDVISGSAIFVRAVLAGVIGPYRVREKAVTVVPSPPVDPLGSFTGSTGDFAGPTWGSDGLWDAKGELGRSCRHPRVTHWFLNPDLWLAGEGSNGIPPLPVDLLRVYTGSSLTNNW